MKVATWNLDQLRPNATRFARQRKDIDDIGADVWVFTETHRDISLGVEYVCAVQSESNTTDLPSEAARWVAIWCKREYAAELIQLEFDHERCAAIRLINSGVVIVGTVLPWNGKALFQQRLAEQAADWRQLRDASDGRLCVTGDFNQDLLPARHYYGSGDGKRALLDELNACSLRCLTGETNDPLKDVPDRASIDHICIGEGLQAKTPATVWPKPGTLLDTKEHYGVWVELEVC